MEGRSLRTLTLLFGLLGVLGLLCGALAFLVAGDRIVDGVRVLTRDFRLSQREGELNAPIGDDPVPREFVISEGESAGSIARSLEASVFIADGDLFLDYVIANDLAAQFVSGTFYLNDTMSIKDMANALTGNEYRALEFTLFGGWRIEQVAEVLDSITRLEMTGADFMAVVGRGAQVDPTFAAYVGLPPGASLEGFLLPGRYVVPKEITPLALRQIMLDNFVNVTLGEIATQAVNEGYSLYEVVTIASIVQREALHDDERPLIAGAYRNRLEQTNPDDGSPPPMNMDADPTVQYPLGEPGDWWPQITRADYQGVQSTYNTYRNPGLPPGPIANPNLASIRAVVFPERSNFFYFRADCRTDGYHDFAPNYAEHLANGC